MRAAHGGADRPRAQLGKSYEGQVVQQAEVGSPMVTITDAYVLPGFTPRYVFQDSSGALPPFVPGQLWGAFHQFEGHNLIVCPQLNLGVGILVDDQGGLPGSKALVSLAVANPNALARPLPGTDRFYLEGITDLHLFEPLKEGFPLHGSFRAEILYNGLFDENISLSYREFVNDFAQPSYFQDLSYNLGKDSHISFRSIRIEIMEATNQYIRFQVLDDGGLPWMPGGS